MDLYFALYGRRRPACVPSANTDATAPQSQEKKFNPHLLQSIAPRPLSPPGITACGMTAATMAGMPEENSGPFGGTKFGTVDNKKNEEAVHSVEIKQEVMLSSLEELPMDTETRSQPENGVPNEPLVEHIRIKSEVEVFEEVIRPLDPVGGGEMVSQRAFPHQEYGGTTTIMDTEMSESTTSVPDDTNILAPSGPMGLTSFQPGIFGEQLPTTTPNIESAFIPVPTAHIVPDDGELITGTEAVALPIDSQVNLVDTTASNKHKLKKRKKDKKHKKHKKHKHKLDKFAPEENLSSGSSNPPSPASTHVTSAPGTPRSLDVNI